MKNGINKVDFLNLKNSIAELNELVSTTLKHFDMSTFGKN